jgi:hypothetical protein
MNEQMRHILCAGTQMKHRKDLRTRIDGQPEPQHLCGAAQPGAQFIQLEVGDLEVAKGALLQEMSVLASARQLGGDGGLTVAEDTFGRGSIQPFSERRQHHCDLIRGVFRRYKGVWRRAVKVVWQA